MKRHSKEQTVAVGRARRDKELSNEVTETTELPRAALEPEALPTINKRQMPVPSESKVDLGTTMAGRYRIVEFLGEGGMGEVYRARDLTLDVDVAVKLLSEAQAADPTRVSYIQNEVKLARKVTHPNICRLHDIVQEGDLWFITMQFVYGESLASRLKRERKIPESETLEILRQIGQGLAAAHAVGVIHRDLKPGNVLLEEGSGRAIIADFGIATEMNASGPVDVAGTRGYMAPEQSSGKAVDERTDIYALGVLGHRMLTGQLPPKTPTIVASAEVAHELVRAPAKTGGGCALFLSRCLATRPSERPASVLEALKLLPGVEEADTERTPKRRSRATVALVLAMVAGAALAIFFAYGNDPSQEAQTSAPDTAARGRLVIRAIDASALGAQRQWQGPALQRRLVNELWDGWEITAQVGAGETKADGASGTGFSGVLTQNEAGQLDLRLAWAHAPSGEPLLVSGSSLQSLALAAAKAIAETTTEVAERAPSQASMARVGATNPEAWRLWRRAQRASLMQQWSLCRLFARQASKLDPDFPLPYFEESWSYGGNDEIRIAPLKRALQTMLKHSEISSNWKVVADIQRVRLAGDAAAEAVLFEKLSKQPMTPEEAYYFNARVLMAKYFDGKPEQTLPAIKYMAEQNAQRADQVKLLANAYLKLQSKQSAEDAVNNARKALKLAPEDVAVRADFVRALLHVGEEEEARRQASWVDSADAQDKLYANSGGERTNSILDMHMALGDAGGARGDVLRMEAGSEIQRGQALHMQAIIDAYEGNEASALDRLQKAMQVFGEVGITEFVTIGRYERALTYFELGNSQAALTVLAESPQIPLSAADKILKLRAQAKLSKEPAALIAEAREILARATFDPSQRALMEMALASDLGEYQKVVDFAARQQGNNGRIAWLYYAGDAHENLGNYEEAELLFRELGNHYNGYTEPRLSARAWLRVAALRERARDKSGAGEAYARFLARYSRAPRTDPEVRRARKRSAKH